MVGCTVLIVMDGFGLREEVDGNAIKQAKTPNLDRYFAEWPFSRLEAHGEAVGLPDGFQGSSEVGHLNIGAGRVVKQEQVMISESVQDGSFFQDETLLEAIESAKRNDGNVHLMGLLSDKGVHSHVNHLFALLELCSRNGVDPYVHAFTDGRDTLPRAAEKYFEMLDEQMEKWSGELKTVVGRYYAMDRDERWDRTRLAYDAINDAEGREVSSWREALDEAYDAGEDDEFIQPRIINGYEGLKEGDSVIFYNYRSDRPRQLTKALIEEDFAGFDRQDFTSVHFVGMVKYYDDMPAPHVCAKPHPDNGFGEHVSKLGFRQCRIAETEKYAHVTYFFSGEQEEPYPGENRIVVPSPKVATYDMKPEMSVYKIKDRCLDVLEMGETDFVIMNFANCDMVGHTGDFEAAVEAVEAVDECVGEIVEKVLEMEGVVFITGDHGNAEEMLTDEGGRVTSHSTADVPFCVVGWEEEGQVKDGKLGDVAPTILKILDIEIPEEMTGDVLV